MDFTHVRGLVLCGEVIDLKVRRFDCCGEMDVSRLSSEIPYCVRPTSEMTEKARQVLWTGGSDLQELVDELCLIVVGRRSSSRCGR